MDITIRTKWIIFVTVLLFTTGSVYVYNPFSSGNKRPLSLSSPSYTDTDIFRINPETILTSLDKGNTDVFLPDSRSLDDRYGGAIIYNKPTSWSQSDNLKIVSALNKFIWQDTLDDWKLYSMIFNVDCQNGIKDLPGGVFTYFKTVFDKGRIVDTWREFEVDSEYSFVASGDGAKSVHPVLGRPSIDIDSLKVTAEDAIRIAEENGGRSARLKVQNQCNIHLVLTPKGLQKGWWVNYGYSTGFEIQIDPYTGKVLK